MKFSVAGALALLIAITSIISSCQSGKKPVRRNVRIDKYAIKQRYGINTVDTPGSKIRDGVIATPNEQKQILIDNLLSLWQKEIPFTTFSGKAKMHYTSATDKQDFVAHIRISKDKAIWINVTAAIGMVSVARIYVTPDSLFLLNYLQREAYRMQIADANKLLPVSVDFAMMQNLIIGNMLNHNGTPKDATDFGGTWTLEVDDTSMTQQIGFNKSDSSMRTLQMRTKDDVMQGMIQFGAYEKTDGRRFSTQRVLTISNAGEPHYLDMNFNKAEFDQPIEFPFSIPKNYKLK